MALIAVLVEGCGDIAAGVFRQQKKRGLSLLLPFSGLFHGYIKLFQFRLETTLNYWVLFRLLATEKGLIIILYIQYFCEHSAIILEWKYFAGPILFKCIQILAMYIYLIFMPALPKKNMYHGRQ